MQYKETQEADTELVFIEYNMYEKKINQLGYVLQMLDICMKPSTLRYIQSTNATHSKLEGGHVSPF